MDITARRNILNCTSNPDGGIDYMVNMEGHIDKEGATRTNVLLRYVPDKLVLNAGSFGVYLDKLGDIGWNVPEDLAVTIISDINNELIPRWIRISVNAPDLAHPAVDTHGVVLEDRQPKWDNPGLLSRLKQI